MFGKPDTVPAKITIEDDDTIMINCAVDGFSISSACFLVLKHPLQTNAMMITPDFFRSLVGNSFRSLDWITYKPLADDTAVVVRPTTMSLTTVDRQFSYLYNRITLLDRYHTGSMTTLVFQCFIAVTMYEHDTVVVDKVRHLIRKIQLWETTKKHRSDIRYALPAIWDAHIPWQAMALYRNCTSIINKHSFIPDFTTTYGTVETTNVSLSRSPFVKGALDCASFIVEKDLQDVKLGTPDSALCHHLRRARYTFMSRLRRGDVSADNVTIRDDIDIQWTFMIHNDQTAVWSTENITIKMFHLKALLVAYWPTINATTYLNTLLDKL